MIIKILGAGCSKCAKLEIVTKKAVEESGVEAVIEKITDTELIVGYGVISTPALVIDEQIMTCGVVPGVPEIKEMIAKRGAGPQTQNAKSADGCSCGEKH